MDEDTDHTPSPLSLSIDFALDQMRETLYELAFHDLPVGDFSRDELEGTLAELVSEALAERMRRRLKAHPGQIKVTIPDVVSSAAKRLREEAGTTQETLSSMMRRLGFEGWKRITVAEVESGKRRLSIEEMIAYAILFDVPAGFLITSFAANEVIELNERVTLTGAQVQELVTGFPPDHSWTGIRLVPTISGRSFADEEGDWRPAADEAGIWASAQEGEHEEMLLFVNPRFSQKETP